MNKFRLVFFKQDYVKTSPEGVGELTKQTGALHATRRREMDKSETSPTYYIPDPTCQHKTYAMNRNLIQFNVIFKIHFLRHVLSQYFNIIALFRFRNYFWNYVSFKYI